MSLADASGYYPPIDGFFVADSQEFETPEVLRLQLQSVELLVLHLAFTGRLALRSRPYSTASEGHRTHKLRSVAALRLDEDTH